MRFDPTAAAAGLLVCAWVLAASPARAVPSNFGSPFNPPKGMLFAIGGFQTQSDHSWGLSMGGAYGLTRHIAPTYSLERTSNRANIASLGAGTAGEILGMYARVGLSVSDVLASRLGPSYNVAVDWGRPLALGLATYGEVSGGLAPSTAPGFALVPGFNYSQALEFAFNQQISMDLEYLGGISQLGRSELLCADLSAVLGHTYLTGTVMFPRSPQAAPPVYLISTAFQLFP